MSEAEAGRAAEGVLCVQIEEAGFAAIAALTLDVILAGAGARRRVAARHSVQAAGNAASARLAAPRTELVEVVLAPVALVAHHARFAAAFALLVALQVS